MLENTPKNYIKDVRLDSLPQPDSHELEKRLFLERMLGKVQGLEFREHGEGLCEEITEEFNESLRDDDREKFSPSELQEILFQVKDAAMKAVLQGFYKSK